MFNSLYKLIYNLRNGLYREDGIVAPPNSTSIPAKANYSKSLEDEIDFKLIDQCHLATVNFSNMSLETKKIFCVLLGISVPSLIKLAGNKLDISLFITIYVLAIAFCFLDCFTYYYQDKLREKMNKLLSGIRNRNFPEDSMEITSGEEALTIEPDRTADTRLWRSIINTSNIFYAFILLLNTTGIILLHINKI